VSCSELQCVVVVRLPPVLQRVSLCWHLWRRVCVALCCNVLVCFSVLQCGVVCCSVLQCAAVCYSVLQYVAVWCSVL